MGQQADFSFAKEFQLLSIFAKEHDRIVTRDELLEALWDEIEFVDDNTLTVNVNRLRKSLANWGLKMPSPLFADRDIDFA